MRKSEPLTQISSITILENGVFERHRSISCGEKVDTIESNQSHAKCVSQERGEEFKEIDTTFTHVRIARRVKNDCPSQNAIARASANAKLNEHMSANDVTRLILKSPLLKKVNDKLHTPNAQTPTTPRQCNRNHILLLLSLVRRASIFIYRMRWQRRRIHTEWVSEAAAGVWII